MCLIIDDSIKSLKNRVVWKVFDKPDGKIVSLFQAAVYPKGKLIVRDSGITREGDYGYHGLHFYRSKAGALAEAQTWYGAYIAKFAVDPADFMFANANEVMYEKATRVGNYIRVG
jgi:hypothetical protein